MSTDSQLMSSLVRMVVPMRREFGIALDVHQFVHDPTYATHIINRARASTDPRLREHAESIEKRLLLGPRAASAATAPAPLVQPAPPMDPAPAGGAPPAASPARTPAGSSEADLRARMMKKYTTGLR